MSQPHLPFTGLRKTGVQRALTQGPGNEPSSGSVPVPNGGSSSTWSRLTAACVGGRQPLASVAKGVQQMKVYFLLCSLLSSELPLPRTIRSTGPLEMQHQPKQRLPQWQPDGRLLLALRGRTAGHRWLWGSGHKGKTGGEEAWEMGNTPREIFIRVLYFVCEGRREGGEKWMQFFTFPDKTSWNLATVPPWQTHRKLIVMWK